MTVEEMRDSLVKGLSRVKTDLRTGISKSVNELPGAVKKIGNEMYVQPVVEDYSTLTDNQLTWGDFRAGGSIVFTALTLGRGRQIENLADGMPSKSRNKPKEYGTPNSTEVVRDENGKIIKYTTYGPDGKIIKEVRLTGKDHGVIPRPNVKEPKYNTNPKTGQKFQNGYEVRPTRPDEIPKNIPE